MRTVRVVITGSEKQTVCLDAPRSAGRPQHPHPPGMRQARVLASVLSGRCRPPRPEMYPSMLVQPTQSTAVMERVVHTGYTLGRSNAIQGRQTMQGSGVGTCCWQGESKGLEGWREMQMRC